MDAGVDVCAEEDGGVVGCQENIDWYNFPFCEYDCTGVDSCVSNAGVVIDERNCGTLLAICCDFGWEGFEGLPGDAPKLSETHPGWKSANCWRSCCHAKEDTHNWHGRPGQCATCHGANGAVPRGHTYVENCFGCHPRPDGPAICTTCHPPAITAPDDHVPCAEFLSWQSCAACHAAP